MNPESRKPIRVLTVGMTSSEGGVENFLMSYCGRIDKSRIRFDFLIVHFFSYFVLNPLIRDYFLRDCAEYMLGVFLTEF